MADNEKVLNTRIKLKIATYDEWTLDNETTRTNKTNANYVLKRGEIGLCEIPQGNAEATTAPTVLFKVGDDTHAFKDLQWASALAADVYSWAKKSETEFTAWVKTLVPLDLEDTGSGKFITGISVNGQKITVTRSNVAWTDIADKPELQPAGNYKTKQDAYSESGSTIKTVTKVEQNANGEVAVTYENIAFPEFPELPDENDFGVLTVTKKDGTAIEVDNADSQNPKIGFIIDPTSQNATGDTAVKLSQSNNGLKAEVDLSNFATKEYISSNEKDTKTTVSAGTLIDVELTTNNKEFKENSANNYKVSVNEAALKTLIGQETTAAMEFKGATASLPTSAVKGDMYKISGEFTVEPAKDAQDEGFTAKVGDSIVYDGAKWYLIPSGDDIEDTWRTIKVDNVSIPSTDTLDLVSTEKIELKTSSLNGITHVEIYHKAAPSDSYSTNGIALNHGDSFTVIEETFDGWGHLNGGMATTYTLPALPTPEDIGAAKPGDIGNGKLAITTESGVLTGSVDFTANQKTDASITIGVAAKGITTAKIADGAIGMSQTKACNEYTGADKEVWVFDCGGAE